MTTIKAFVEQLPKVTAFSHYDRRPVTDLLILPVWGNGTKAVSIPDLDKIVGGVLATQDFSGKVGETLVIYQGIAEKRVLLLGLGKPEELTAEVVRQAYYSAFKAVDSKKVRQVVVALPQTTHLSFNHLFQCTLDGFYYSQYRFTEYKSEEYTKVALEQVYIHAEPHEEVSEIITQQERLFRSIFFVRDQVNQNADHMTPAALVHNAFQVAEMVPEISCSVLEKKQIEELGMGLFLAVAQGSAYEPYLLHLRYQGNKKSSDSTLFVGKAITFDTGGLQIKTGASMDIMRNDMAGAATLLGLLPVVVGEGLPINIDVLIPVCENAIGSRAFKPGDMIKSMKGLFVEITSTDAEGRLCLADALTYGVQKLNPSRIIDIATLTGSMEIALGSDISGFITNSEPLAQAFEKASLESGEFFWRLPLYEPYADLLKSDLADIKNTGGRSGGAIIAALFLQKFVENKPWVHIDIAGTAYLKESRKYLGKGATGVAVRLLTDYCRGLV